MLFTPETVKPEGLEILHKNPYTQWVKDHILFVQPNKRLEFLDEQALFTLGWKKQNDIWFYNLAQAFILGDNNEEK